VNTFRKNCFIRARPVRGSRATLMPPARRKVQLKCRDHIFQASLFQATWRTVGDELSRNPGNSFILLTVRT
jgi:hypothetical protein